MARKFRLTMPKRQNSGSKDSLPSKSDTSTPSTNKMPSSYIRKATRALYGRCKKADKDIKLLTSDLSPAAQRTATQGAEVLLLSAIDSEFDEAECKERLLTKFPCSLENGPPIDYNPLPARSPSPRNSKSSKAKASKKSQSQLLDELLEAIDSQLDEQAVVFPREKKTPDQQNQKHTESLTKGPGRRKRHANWTFQMTNRLWQEAIEVDPCLWTRQQKRKLDELSIMMEISAGRLRTEYLDTELRQMELTTHEMALKQKREILDQLEIFARSLRQIPSIVKHERSSREVRTAKRSREPDDDYQGNDDIVLPRPVKRQRR